MKIQTAKQSFLFLGMSCAVLAAQAAVVTPTAANTSVPSASGSERLTVEAPNPTLPPGRTPIRIPIRVPSRS